jgi:hypothetical protein
MNEKIKQLATEARLLTGWPVGEVEYQKFAELIVRECVDVVKWTPSMFPNDAIIKNIKEHFGVTE